MNSIAAAVIGGTSLFGGRGRTWNALLGVLVIVSIQYGLALQGIASPIQYMITGAVLLATVVIDAVHAQDAEDRGSRLTAVPAGQCPASSRMPGTAVPDHVCGSADGAGRRGESLPEPGREHAMNSAGSRRAAGED